MGKRIFFMLCLLILTLSYLSSINVKSPDVSTSSLFDRFSAMVRFTGKHTDTTDGRIFTELHGTFNLPKPVDAAILCKNSDRIVNDLMILYKEQGAAFVLKMISSPAYTHSCLYVQYWKNYYLVNQPYYLLITYHPETAEYSIYNTLYFQPIQIPGNAVTPQTAISIFNFISAAEKMNPNLSDVPKQFTATDTMSTFYHGPEYDSDYGNLSLNLYPDSNSEQSPGFILQWKRNNETINAQTGDLLGKTAKDWIEKVKKINAVIEFVKNTGLKGKYYASIEYGIIRLGDIDLSSSAINDSISYRLAIDKFIPYYVMMHKHCGQDIRLEYAKTDVEQEGNTNKRYTSYYRQMFKYPIPQGSMEGYFRLTAEYDCTRNVLSLEPYFYAKPIIYPDSVIVPQAILTLYANQKDNQKEVKAFNAKDQNRIATKNITYKNSYHDPINHLTAKLCMMPRGNQYEEGISSVVLAWCVFEDSNPNYYTAFEPQTGQCYDPGFYELRPVPLDAANQTIFNKEKAKLQEVFKPLGNTSNYQFDQIQKKITSFAGVFNLPEPRDSVQMHVNCQKIISYLFKLNQITDPNYSFRIRLNDGGEYSNGMTLNLCYEGFLLLPVFTSPGFEMNMSIYYDYDSNKYEVSFFMYNALKPLPECIITPETALSINSYEDKTHYVWTETRWLSGSKDYFPHEQKIMNPEEDENPEDSDQDCSAMLIFYPIKSKITNEYEYRLIWSINTDGQWIAIDAETGVKLEEKSWDTC